MIVNEGEARVDYRFIENERGNLIDLVKTNLSSLISKIISKNEELSIVICEKIRPCCVTWRIHSHVANQIAAFAIVYE